MTMYNYHTHTFFCDGSAEPIKYTEEALRLGFKALGYSGHAPVPFENSFAIPEERLTEYTTAIRALKRQFSNQIEIYLSLEIDFIPGITKRFSSFVDDCELDYTIGSVHLVKSTDSDGLWFIDGSEQKTYDKGVNELFGGDIKRAVKAYFVQLNQMIEIEKPDIVGHFDKIKMHNAGRWFDVSDKWYTDLIKETITLIAEKDLIVEVNTRGVYKGRCDSFFPGLSELKFLKDKRVKLITSSDAHKPEELILGLIAANEMVTSLGYKETKVSAILNGFDC